MAEKSDTKIPPYVGFTTFMNFINGLRETGVPSRIDNSIMRNLSGSAQSSLLTALRYFNLIGENGAPGADLEPLVLADDKGRPALIANMLTSGYPFLKNRDIDLKAATPQMLAEVFRKEGASGGTLDKSIAFFLAAAAAAQFALSAHITKGRHTGNGSPSPKRRTSSPKASKKDTQDAGNKNPPDGGAGNIALDLEPLLIAMLRMIPAKGQEWPKEKRLRWFRTFAMNASQIYDDPTEPIDLRIELEGL